MHFSNPLKIIGFAIIFPQILWSPAHAWTIDQSYDQQLINERCENWGAGGKSIVNNLNRFSGPNSCSVAIDAGKTGFGAWGGILTHPTNLIKGDEIWIRLRTFMPLNFNYDSTSGGNRLKFLRVHTRNLANSNFGYDDWYINPKGSSTPFSFIYEGEQKWSHFGTTNDIIQLGKWETYEFYIRLDNITADNGGQAVVKMWKNGNLISQVTNRITLQSADGFSDRTHIFTYWNGGSPATQKMYIDDLRITNETPLAKDAVGNSFIGMGGTGNTPEPPNSFTVR